MAAKTKNLKWVIIGIILLVVIIVGAIASIYIDLIWFKSVQYVNVFWKILLTKGVVMLFFAAAFFILSFINLSFARRFAPEFQVEISQDEFERPEIQLYKSLQNIQINKKFVFWFSLILALFMGFSEGASWEKILIYLNRTSFGITDPIFNKDIGFYMFSLPFWEFVRNWLSFALTLITVVVAAIYIIKKAVKYEYRKLVIETPVKVHLSLLIGFILILKSWQYWLNAFKILYSTRAVIYGAGYTEIHATLFALRILMVLALVCAVLFFVTARRQNWKLPALGLAVLIGVSILLGGVYPEIMQKAIVLPNESSKERPYILNNIKATRAAYGLDKIEEEEFPVKEEISLEDIEKNDETIRNIRLWDWRPIKQTLKQIQAIRLYYDFNSVDMDRYYFNGNYQQVMVSPRELDKNKIPEQARTWVNEVLTYTHGYGAVVNPVNKISGEGLPYLLIKDIPPVSSVNLTIKRPEIYYGEITKDYVIVKTKAKEFDYPKGDDNVYSTYAGNGGIAVSSLWRRILFSIKYSNMQILLTTNFTPESKIMIYRNIQERVNKVAPFLGYDRDPYMVISKEGKLFWIQDAYTVSSNYPYSTPIKGGYFNYIRNSVKVVIDAYNGTMDFYVIDQKDPVVKVYQNIFPQLFKNFNQMPENLKEHIRYPKDLFQVQAELYSTYHMMDPDVFYNKEDYWNTPNEIYAENEIRMEPYYIVTRLPGHEREEFILMTPFTPSTKNNMIAWLAAKNDQPDYGNLIVYKFPKEKLIFGPMQIEARIDQDSEISQQLTLWGQKGSTVIRGNLLVIPIEESIIYVEPLYLRAETGEIPELKRVIVSNGSDVVIGNNLEDALEKLFARSFREREIVVTGEEKTLKDLIKEAAGYYESAQKYAREGNWSKYGEELQKLEQTLKLLQEASERE
ncbi:MAG TPA: UPF0182 family protein [Candidatus Atribacteria bacterium]|nr:UPF0182 family protein [Candidatus Atribacteria bacterium]